MAGNQTMARGGRRTERQSRFATAPGVTIPRSVFGRSHGYKTTLDAGWLVPVFVDEGLPGDTWSMAAASFCRMATPLTPFMDNLTLDVHFFSVPNRLIWDNWKFFMGEEEKPGDNETFTYEVPQIQVLPAGYSPGSVFDYMGLPLDHLGLEHSVLPLRAYNLIWNEWYRAQDIQESVQVPTGDGPDNPATYTLLRRNKRHDYFTSALPFAQKGSPVQIPLGDEAPVIGDPNSSQVPVFNVGPTGGALEASGGGVNPDVRINADGSQDAGQDLVWNDPNLVADLSQAESVTVNQLRNAVQIQRLMERDARSGTRYTEVLRAHFGVTSPDARQQRPEYLGGMSGRINVHPVATTAETEEGVTGELSAFATSGHVGERWHHTFTEHCTVIGLASIRADLSYQEGLERQWSRKTKYDFYWPALAHLGEQAIRNKELYAVGAILPEQDEATFGYQERWAEYRYKPAKITGAFRSDHPQSLDVWHLGQDFASVPGLNPAFLEENPPVDRVIAVTNEPQFLLDLFFDFKCARCMPTYSVPGLLDHF